MMRELPLADDLAAVAAGDEEAGFGALRTARGCLPLVAMDVRARIAGLVSHVAVRQTFRNTLAEPIEATYVFPLPDRAGITACRMLVGQRVIEARLKEREQARADYDAAIAKGHRAAIAEEERSGVFTLRVGNIPPGETVAVELTLVGPLPVDYGEATFRFPLVVAPRYVPGVPLEGSPVGLGTADDTDRVPDASRITPPVLLPGFPNPVRLSLEVEIDPAGLAIDAATGLRSSLHSVEIEEGPPWRVRLHPGERLDRDFLLRFPVAGAAIQTTLLAAGAADGHAGAAALLLVPPTVPPDQRAARRDVVFVLDRSGSMAGWKMVAARRAVGRMIDTLQPHDRFTVLAFDNVVEKPPHASGLVDANDRNRWQAMEWVGGIDSRGGTEMEGALGAAISLLTGGDAQPIIVLVTDGQVAAEDAILKRLRSAAGKRLPRVHALGIDQAVNAGFLRRLADLGGGTCELVESEDRLDEALARMHRTLGTPALSQLSLECLAGAWDADSLTPMPLPDLFADRPVTILVRHASDPATLRWRVRGLDAAGRPWSQEVAPAPAPADVLRPLWGRARVRDLEDAYAVGVSDNREAAARRIAEVSLEAGVLSRFTAYVAVDENEVVNPGGAPLQVVQSVEMPAGWGGQVLAAAAPMRMMRRAALPMSSPSSMKTEAADEMLGDSSIDFCKTAAETDPSVLQLAIAKLAVRLAGRRWPWTKGRLQILVELVSLLTALAAHPAVSANDATEARRCAEACQRLLQDTPADTAPKPEALESVLSSVRTLLERLAPPKPKRGRFWT